MSEAHCENECEYDTPNSCAIFGCQFISHGVVGILCEATTIERVVRKTQAGPLHKAVCNRWYSHPGLHLMTDKRFVRLHQWTDAECGAPDIMKERRREMAAAARVGEVRVQL